MESLVGGLLLLVGGLSKLEFSLVYLLYMLADLVCNLFTCCGHVDAHACKTWLVGGCCLSVVCQKMLFFHLCMFDRCVLNACAICLHVVGMWVHMLAQLCLLIVAACLWFVNACSSICASEIGVRWNG